MIESTGISVDLHLISQALDNLPDGDVVVLNQKTGRFFYDPWEIKLEFKNTVWEEILNSLPYDKGEARIIVLKPGESYMAHSDIDDRWHLNFSGSYAFLIDLENKVMHETVNDGVWYVMDTSKIHVASNFGSTDRVQLVVRNLLTESKKTDLIDVKIVPATAQHDYRYKFDHTWSPWLNLNSKKGLISNFNFDKDVVSFRMCPSLILNLKKTSNSNFIVTYE